MSASPRSNLRKLALIGSGYEVIGFGASQAIRLAGNLALARLLAPEAFGLVTLVTLFSQGLYMFSDLGIQPAVVQSERGDDASFLRTAWTLQIVRGLILGVVALALAWPMALLYGDARLTPLLSIGAIGVVCYSLTSSAMFTLRRNVRVGPLVALEVGVQVATLALTIILAVTLKSVWALLLGFVASNAFRAAASYLLPPAHSHKFRWEPEALAAIRRFGKWILYASALHFVSRQGDRLLLGKLLGITELGLYSIAVTLSEAMSALLGRVTHGVIFPLLSRARQESRDQIGVVYYRSRAALDALALPPLGMLLALGSAVIELLYDDRYHQAGWMLEALSVRVAMLCVLTPWETCLTALGKTQYAFLQGIARTLWIAVAAPIAFTMFGLKGLVWAMALSEVPVVFVLMPPLIREGVFRVRRELFTIVLFLAGYAVGHLVERLLVALRG